MSGWVPPESTLISGSNREPSPGWEPPEDTLVGPDKGKVNGGTRVENPNLESFAGGFASGLGSGTAMWGGAALGGVITKSPWGVAAGGIAGLVGGQELVDKGLDAFGVRTPQQMAPDQRVEGESSYSLGAGLGAMLTPIGAASVGLKLLDRGPGRWLNNVIKQFNRAPKTFVAAEVSGVVAAATGAGYAEKHAPGNAVVRGLAEVGGAVIDPFNRAITVWNMGNSAFNMGMRNFGRSAGERKIAEQLINGMKEIGNDPDQVIKVLAAGNPYGLTAAQLTADPVLMATERALVKKSDVFAQARMEKGVKMREAMTAQINLLKMDGQVKHIKEISEIRLAQFNSLMGDLLEDATSESKRLLEQGMRKGMTEENLGDISLRARAPLDAMNTRAKTHIQELYDGVGLAIPVGMKNIEATVEDVLSRTADTLKKDEVPSWLMDTIKAARKAAGTRTSYDPDTFVITETPGEMLTDSRTMISLRRRLLSVSLDPNAKPYEKTLATKFQTALMKDLDTAFKEGLDESYDKARSANAAYHDAFERSFVGDALALKKHGEMIPPELLLQRAFATGGEAANGKLQDLEEATRYMTSRGFADDGTTELMLKAQEDAYRLISTVSMKDGHVNPMVMRDYIRKNGVLFNREPFVSVRDDLLDAIKSEEGLRRLEGFVKNRRADVGKNSAFAKISGSDPVKYASEILVSTSDQENKFLKMFNLAKKGGTNRQGVQLVSPEEGVSSARASIINSAYELAKTKSGTLNLDTFRELLFTPNVSGQKSPITIMREQGVMEPEHVQNLSKMFQTLDAFKVAERQGVGVDIQKGPGELGLILSAKIAASKAASWIQKQTGQSGASIIIAGAVSKTAEAIVSKIPAHKADMLAMKLFNDPEALANVLKRGVTVQERKLQLSRFHSWAIQTGLTTTRDDEITSSVERPPEPTRMYSQ